MVSSGLRRTGRTRKRTGAPSCRCHVLVDRACLPGLERLERAERPHELGHGGAAVAQQRLEAAGAVAVADQRDAGATVAPASLGEHLDLHAIGAGKPPSGDRDAPREHRLERAEGCELIEERRLEHGELHGILVRQYDMHLRAHPVL
jgi:hypothetical protein